MKGRRYEGNTKTKGKDAHREGGRYIGKGEFNTKGNGLNGKAAATKATPTPKAKTPTVPD
ncbi:MAG TPA: hypothetical protein VJR23_19030 [Candidatus Acidoferrales bacterium]|nr:hypothetical protein [Candidatus Acidoferrales bacterium]